MLLAEFLFDKIFDPDYFLLIFNSLDIYECRPACL